MKAPVESCDGVQVRHKAVLITVIEAVNSPRLPNLSPCPLGGIPGVLIV